MVLAGAVKTTHDGRVEIKPPFPDEFAAGVAPAEVFVSFEPPDRCLQGADAGVTAAFLRGSHGLLLHGIHARQASDALLVKFDGLAMFGGGLRVVPNRVKLLP